MTAEQAKTPTASKGSRGQRDDTSAGTSSPVATAIAAYEAIRRALKDPNPRWIIP